MSSRRLVAALACTSVLLAASPAAAHWCNCLWASGYNLVVRPAQDSVSVPASGAATLDLFVQNNMGYPLVNFVLYAEASGYTINVTGPSPKVANYLMPGEKLKRTLTISGSGGSLGVEAIDFYVSFGNGGLGGQSGYYGNYGNPYSAVAIKKTDGTVGPAGLPGLGESATTPDDQGAHLRYLAEADFGSGAAATTGLADLVKAYCAGRGSWDSGSPGSMSSTYCPDTQIKACPAAVTQSGFTKFQAQHLWSAAHLAARKSVLGSYLPALRARFQCGFKDSEPAAKYLALFALGYLGEDAGARTFLEGLVGGGNANDALVAKAALLMMGDTQYDADVTAGASASGDLYVASACAGAVGIVDKNDQKVQEVLLAKARWYCPAERDGGGSDPGPFFASHILAIVSWDRRGYSVGAGDTGDPSYFGTGVADTVKPKAPTGAACTASAGGGIRVSWAAVTQGVDGQAEPAGVGYQVYSDTAAHAGCVNPGDAGCNYAHKDPASGIFRDFSGLDGTQTYRYRVTAVDAAGNESAFSSEVECTPKLAPVADLSCTPATGDAPLDVTCDASGSTDGNGAADISAYAFKLDTAAEESGTAKTKAYHFDVAGGHTVQVKVTDSTGQSDTATASITVSVAGNKPPVADAQGSPLSGPAPLTVAFDGSSSSDQEDPAASLTFSWDFGDSSAKATEARPSHTYATAGQYTASLTVTDTGGASSTAVLSVDVKGNLPPDVSTASASPTAGLAPLKVHFDATGVSDPDGDAVTLTWDFGDGSAVSHEASVDHTYSAQGTVTARLSAQDDGVPAIGPATASFTIGVGVANRAPDCAKATVTPTSGNAPLTLHLDASGCTDPDNNQLTFEWRVPTSLTTDDVVYTAAKVDHELTAAAAAQLPLNPQVHLSVKDDGAPSLETTRDWPLTITTGGGDGSDAGGSGQTPITSGCACTASGSAPGPLALAMMLALGMTRRRRAR